jgi:hypothetical protein
MLDRAEDLAPTLESYRRQDVSRCGHCSGAGGRDSRRAGRKLVSYSGGQNAGRRQLSLSAEAPPRWREGTLKQSKIGLLSIPRLLS